MNELRSRIRLFLKESFHQETLDLILDKIAKYGIESLNFHEKKLLDDMSSDKKINSDTDLVFHFMDFNLGELQGESYHLDKMAKKVYGIKYYSSKTNDFIFDLEVESIILGVKKKPNSLYANALLNDLLFKNFTISEIDAKNIIKLWFEKTTDMKISNINFFHTNV